MTKTNFKHQFLLLYYSQHQLTKLRYLYLFVFDENNSIIGIKSGDDEITSKLVIAADGATSIITKKAGLRNQFNSEHFSVGIKEVIELPSNVINDRFCISENNGAALVCVGFPTNYLRGGAFIYTNKSSISIGLIHPFFHAVSVIYFSIDPIVTVPCPDCSITQLPSHNLS